MSKNKNQIADLTLKRLAISIAGEASEPEDVLLVLERYELKHAEWTERCLVNWDYNSVPDFAAASVSALLAVDLMSEFETPPEIQNELIIKANNAQMTLDQLQAKPRSESPLRACYF